MAGRWWRRVSPPEAEEIDHISHLPDAIIHHIFSFLPFKDVVKTSVLSQQWRFTWTSTPYIDLSVTSKDAVPLISRALRRCTAPKIKKFHLDATTLDSNFPELLDLWFPSAVARKVEDVSLGSVRRYHLPQILRECTSLVSLRVYGCGLPRDTIIKCTSLKKLCLDNFEFEDDGNIILLSNVLESLTFRSSTKLFTVRTDRRSLRELVIENVLIKTLDISAPNLLSLRLSGHFSLNCFRQNVVSPLLAEATTLLDCNDRSALSGHLPDQLKCLEQLQHVPKITIGSWWVEVLSAAESKGMSHILSSWRSIVVYTIVCKRDLLGMAYLLQSSPLLERLVICNPKSNYKDNNCWNLTDFDEKEFRNSQRAFHNVANHLKRVEIVGFEFGDEKSKPLLDLAKFILEKAIILEKMIIKVELRTSSRGVPTNPPGLGCFHDVIQLKEGCLRASPNAEVIIDFLLDGAPHELYKHKCTSCSWFNFLRGICDSKNSLDKCKWP